MAHDGTGTGWDEASPAGTEVASFGDDEIRDLRKGVRIRLEKEHDTPAAASAGGEHKAGSAKAYHGSTPTLRPDGTTALDSNDEGRLYVDDSSSGNALPYYYDGNDFKALSVAKASSTTAVAASYGSYITVSADNFFGIVFVDNGGGGANFVALAPAGSDAEFVYSCVDSGGVTQTFTVQCDRNSDTRFRIKSSTFTGTMRYMVF